MNASAGNAQATVNTGLTNGVAYTFKVAAINIIGTSAYSANSNSVTPLATVPAAPTIGAATAGRGQATVSFTPSTNTGGSPITGYRIVSTSGGLSATGTASPITITGLTNGTSYSFVVYTINAVGASAASAASNSVIPSGTNTVPAAPTIGIATAGDKHATVRFTAPINTSGLPITQYKIVTSPGGLTVTGSSSPIVVTGLSNGTAYTFTAYALNALGSSVASAASNSVTPTARTAPNSAYFIQTDHINTPRSIFNTSKQEVWRWDNTDPYGANPANENPSGLGSFTFNLRFAGQYYDKESGLHYNRHRYYDPYSARYLQSDPIGLRGGINTYAYVGANPLSLTDPDGLSPIDGVFFVADVAKLGVALYSGVGIGAAAIDVGMSAIGVVVPFPGAGQALKVARAADHLADASHARSAVKQVCCFVAGTPVLTQDGNKPIETIQLGDLVLSKNTETGEVAYKPVTELFKKYREIYELRVQDETGKAHLIETTDDHPFYVVGFGFVKTTELASGSLIETQSGKQVTVQSVSHSGRTDHTYNIEVADFHTYYATAVGVLVHNVCDFTPGPINMKSRSKAGGEADRVVYTIYDKKGDVIKFGVSDAKLGRLARSFEEQERINGAVRYTYTKTPMTKREAHLYEKYVTTRYYNSMDIMPRGMKSPHPVDFNTGKKIKNPKMYE